MKQKIFISILVVLLCSFVNMQYASKEYEYKLILSEDTVGARYPAHHVNWFDALIYCNKRSIDEGLTPCFSIFDFIHI